MESMHAAAVWVKGDGGAQQNYLNILITTISNYLLLPSHPNLLTGIPNSASAAQNSDLSPLTKKYRQVFSLLLS